MKSQNDLFHGDENTTDKPKKYLIEASEVVYYEIEVEAVDEQDAINKAFDTPIDENTPIKKSDGFQIDNVAEVDDAPEPDYNYSLNYGGTD